MRRRPISQPDVLNRIRAACVAAGGQARFARSCGVGSPYLSEVLAGDKPPGPSVLAALGLRKVERPPVYVPIEREAHRNVRQNP